MAILRLFCVCALFLPLCCAQVPQTSPAQQWAEVIEGSKEPDRIDDSVAWFMFFKVLASGPNAFPEETRLAFLKDCGLTENQIAQVMRVAEEVAEEIRQMEERVKGSYPNLEAKTTMLLSERDAIVHIAVNDLLVHRVDYDAGEKLKRHLDHRIKRAITAHILPSNAPPVTSAVFSATDNYNNVVATAITDAAYQMGGACAAYATAKITSPDGRIARVSGFDVNTVIINAMLSIDNDDGRYITENFDPRVLCPVAVRNKSSAGIGATIRNRPAPASQSIRLNQRGSLHSGRGAASIPR